MRLYDLAEQFNDLLEQLEAGDEFPGLAQMVDGIEVKLEEKLESVAAVMKTLEHEEAAMKAEEERLAKRRAAIAANRSRLKEYTEAALAGLKDKKLKGKLFSLALQKSGPSVQVEDEKLIPRDWFITPAPPEPRLNKSGILEAFKGGQPIPPGVKIVQSESLRIR